MSLTPQPSERFSDDSFAEVLLGKGERHLFGKSGITKFPLL